MCGICGLSADTTATPNLAVHLDFQGELPRLVGGVNADNILLRSTSTLVAATSARVAEGGLVYGVVAAAVADAEQGAHDGDV